MFAAITAGFRMTHRDTRNTNRQHLTSSHAGSIQCCLFICSQRMIFLSSRAQRNIGELSRIHRS